MFMCTFYKGRFIFFLPILSNKIVSVNAWKSNSPPLLNKPQEPK